MIHRGTDRAEASGLRNDQSLGVIGAEGSLHTEAHPDALTSEALGHKGQRLSHHRQILIFELVLAGVHQMPGERHVSDGEPVDRAVERRALDGGATGEGDLEGEVAVIPGTLRYGSPALPDEVTGPLVAAIYHRNGGSLGRNDRGSQPDSSPSRDQPDARTT